MSGKIYLVGTPIGNLEDITYRAVRIMNEADIIFAEDTRHTRKLLNHLSISKPLKSYHDHNKEVGGQQIIDQLELGHQVVLVSDAGMPGISDPGEVILRQCVELGYGIEVIPGPTAMTTGLVGSGLSTGRFAFEGFLPRKRKDVMQRLLPIADDTRTLIFYESPHRINKTISFFIEAFGGDRKAVIARELTKKFETYHRGTLNELLSLTDEKELRGEMVVIIEGAVLAVEDNWTKETILDVVNEKIDDGMNKKDAMKEVAKLSGVKKQEIYKWLLEGK